MDRKAVGVLLLALAIFPPARLSGQEVILPLLIEGPRISRTAFTNWESIELTYTVRWMDGYEPIWAELKPQKMSFGILELDQEFAEETDIKNERKFEKENYVDIIYRLRYMGEKKGEITVPGPKFAYKQVQSGESQVQYFPTQEFKLSYGTVLTSNADDIKEEFDLGSYQTTATLWKVFSGVIVLIGIIGSFVLIFFRPVPVSLAAGVAGASVPEIAEKDIDLTKVISGLEANITEGKLGAVCNGLSDVIRAYVPGIKQGMTSKDMAKPILSISYEWERNRLLQVHTALCDIENHLFDGGDDVNDKIKYQMSHLATTVHELRPWSVYWHCRLFDLKEKLTRPFSSIKRFNWRRP